MPSFSPSRPPEKVSGFTPSFAKWSSTSWGTFSTGAASVMVLLFGVHFVVRVDRTTVYPSVGRCSAPRREMSAPGHRIGDGSATGQERDVTWRHRVQARVRPGGPG
ncbi:hypothetical protein GCM10010195_14900 [Kitasatospora griseola]|nr:hypothetical protein GCM10010195_14900 [Kitasatospora griseola]